MKSSILTSFLGLALVSAKPYYAQSSGSKWAPAGPNDVRGPCPMMNTLANHGFLPHDGKNITKENAIRALNTGLNFDTTLGGIMWDQAIIANPEPNATFFTLEHLNRHNVLEHDASISRTDEYFGNNHLFNQTIFDTTLEYWTDEVLTVEMIANSKLARQLASKVTNPNYRFTETVENFSLGEMAAPLLVFGDVETGTSNRSHFVYLIENERLPIELGWSKKAESITLEKILAAVALVKKAATLITTDSAQAVLSDRSNLHAGSMH